MHEGYDPLVDAAPPFHIRPRSSNPARSRTHSSTTRARPTGGKTASARNPRCQEIWQVSTASSLSSKTPPTMCQNSKASKISCCPSIPSRGRQEVPSTRSKPAWREHATSRSLPHFFLPHIERTPHIGNCVHVVVPAHKSLSFCTSSKRPLQKRRYLVSTPPSEYGLSARTTYSYIETIPRLSEPPSCLASSDQHSPPLDPLHPLLQIPSGS
jgi:hypothetical protein